LKVGADEQPQGKGAIEELFGQGHDERRAGQVESVKKGALGGAVKLRQGSAGLSEHGVVAVERDPEQENADAGGDGRQIRLETDFIKKRGSGLVKKGGQVLH